MCSLAMEKLFHGKFVMYLLLLILSLSSCNDPTKVRWWMPNGRIYAHMPKNNNPVYTLAWKQGCESGMSTGFSKEFNKSFHKYQIDTRFSGHKYSDPKKNLFNGKEITSKHMALYQRAWYDAFKVCRHYSVSMYKMPALSGDAGGDTMPKTPGSAVGYWDDPSQIYEFNAWNNAYGNVAFW